MELTDRELAVTRISLHSYLDEYKDFNTGENLIIKEAIESALEAVEREVNYRIKRELTFPADLV